jgi:hypothetical protein
VAGRVAPLERPTRPRARRYGRCLIDHSEHPGECHGRGLVASAQQGHHLASGLLITQIRLTGQAVLHRWSIRRPAEGPTPPSKIIDDVSSLILARRTRRAAGSGIPSCCFSAR